MNTNEDEIKSLRLDWKIARFLYRAIGLEAARDWMKAPLVDLAGSNIERIEHEQKPNPSGWLDPVWIDAVFHYAHVGAAAKMEILSRVIHIPPFKKKGKGKFFERKAKSLGTIGDGHKGFHDFMQARPEDDADFFIQFALRPSEETGLHTSWQWGGSVAVRIIRENLQIEVCPSSTVSPMFEIFGNDPEVALQGALNLILTSTNRALVYVKECEETFVDVEATLTDKARKKNNKSRRSKPWTDLQAPRVILLSPKKHYPAHGRSEPQGGTHASPIPHQRSAHYRTYRHPRFVHVRNQTRRIKPYWVGEREWIHREHIYRVIDPEPENEK